MNISVAVEPTAPATSILLPRFSALTMLILCMPGSIEEARPSGRNVWAGA
jgi:hypothetical protein